MSSVSSILGFLKMLIFRRDILFLRVKKEYPWFGLQKSRVYPPSKFWIWEKKLAKVLFSP
jgi:hypothetical protein